MEPVAAAAVQSERTEKNNKEAAADVDFMFAF